MRAPRMWDVERGPRASLGRQKAHGDGLVGVFEASSVVAVQSLRGIVGHPLWLPLVRGSVSRESMISGACPRAPCGEV